MGWLEDYLAAAATGRNALMEASSGNRGFREHLSTPTINDPAAPLPDENEPQGTGQAGLPAEFSRPVQGSRVFLGEGRRPVMGTGDQRARPAFKRFAVRRGNKMLEAHDYGGGDVRFMERKNPALLQAAARLARAQQGGQSLAAADVGLGPSVDPDEERRLRYLLGQ